MPDIFDEIQKIVSTSGITLGTPTDQAVLAHMIAWEDAREGGGLLHHADRLTCHTCHTWATRGHTASRSHARRLAADAERVLLNDRAAAMAHGNTRRTEALAFIRSLCA